MKSLNLKIKIKNYLKSVGITQYHDQRLFSNSKVDFKSVIIVSSNGQSDKLLWKIHGKSF